MNEFASLPRAFFVLEVVAEDELGGGFGRHSVGMEEFTLFSSFADVAQIISAHFLVLVRCRSFPADVRRGGDRRRKS